MRTKKNERQFKLTDVIEKYWFQPLVPKLLDTPGKSSLAMITLENSSRSWTIAGFLTIEVLPTCVFVTSCLGIPTGFWTIHHLQRPGLWATIRSSLNDIETYIFDSELAGENCADPSRESFNFESTTWRQVPDP